MLLTGILKDAAVSDARIRLFANHVQRFNQDMDSAWLTTSFETSEPSDLKYDPYAMQDLWAEKEGSFPGWNCRITAFGLFGDFVSFHGDISADAGAGTLFMDYETLDEDPDSLCGDSPQKVQCMVCTCCHNQYHRYTGSLEEFSERMERARHHL